MHEHVHPDLLDDAIAGFPNGSFGWQDTPDHCPDCGSTTHVVGLPIGSLFTAACGFCGFVW